MRGEDDFELYIMSADCLHLVHLDVIMSDVQKC